MAKSSYWYNPTFAYNNLTTLELFLTLSSVSLGSSPPPPIQIKFPSLPGQLQPAQPIAAPALSAPAVLILHQPGISE